MQSERVLISYVAISAIAGLPFAVLSADWVIVNEPIASIGDTLVVTIIVALLSGLIWFTTSLGIFMLLALVTHWCQRLLKYPGITGVTDVTGITSVDQGETIENESSV